jgi:ABC-type transport system involved in multi-copper enzyme maturation permease subunit
MAPLIVIIFNFVLKSGSLSPSRSRSLVIAGFSLVFYVGGLLLAIYALSQVRSAGKKGVLAPALVGLVLNGLFLLFVGSVVLANRDARAQTLLRDAAALAERLAERRSG